MATSKEQPKATQREVRRVKFMNNEDPDLDVTFSFQGKNMSEPEQYRLYPGQEYDLPKDVIEHLNNQAYPIYRTEPDPVTGQTKHVRTGMFNRFTCHPVG